MYAAWYVPSVNDRRAGLRYRCLYPISALQARGIKAELFQAQNAGEYEVVVFDAWTLFPTVSSEALAQQTIDLAIRLKSNGQRIVLDNCDNQFAGAPDKAWEEGCARVRQLAALADTVVTCSSDLAKVMQAECRLSASPRVIGDPIEKRIRYLGDSFLRAALSPGRKLKWLRYLKHRLNLLAERASGSTPLVWFGGHGNSFADGGMLDLKRIIPVLTELQHKHPLSLTVISNNRAKFEANFSNLAFKTHYIEWDRVTFLATLRLHAISLLPIALNDFTRCKSANRLTLSLYHGLNVVADTIPSYSDFSAVCQLDNWHQGLLRYMEDPQLRKMHLKAGKDLVLDGFDLERIADQWLAALRGHQAGQREDE